VVQSGNTNPTVMAIRYADELEGLSGLSGMPAMSNNCYHVTGVSAGFEVGGVDYITKPLHNQEVMARIKTHLTLRLPKRIA
jgi:Response regulator containing a CheY-like receiver domain and a GGDEF domain